MSGKKAALSFVSIALASDMTEAIRIRMLLDRTRIPYRVKNELISNIYSMSVGNAIGPMEFQVPSELYPVAMEVLEEIYEIRMENIPEECPACDARTIPGRTECPSCGLFLA